MPMLIWAISHANLTTTSRHWQLFSDHCLKSRKIMARTGEKDCVFRREKT